MTFLAANWGWLLLASAVLMVCAALCQLRNMNKMTSNMGDRLNTMMEGGSPFKGMIGGMIPVVIFAISATATGITAIIGVIANLMQ